MKTHRILFLAADPNGADRLALDREARSIHAELKRSGYRDRFDFITRWAAEPLDLLRELRELRPTVVHFTGRRTGLAGENGPVGGRDAVDGTAPTGGPPQGLYFHDPVGGAQLVSPEAIAQAFGATGASVKVVVLSACYTASIAEALLEHVDCVVGMNGSTHHDAARSFALGFYGGLGEHESVATAFEQGRAAMNLEGLADTERPQLKVRRGFDAAQLMLATIAPSVVVALPCPYPGMRPYAADDATGFHGRDSEVQDLIGRLRAGEREIYVIGPSGSGKSSLVAAGVLPQLARGVTGLGPFAVRELRPGEKPFLRLCQTLNVPPGQPLSPNERIAAMLAHRASATSILMVVDQLEELFTLADADERKLFLDALQMLRAEHRCRMVFTLRADFFGALMESPLWPGHTCQLSRIEVAPLRGAALREAIAAPACVVGVTVEPALLERLVADAASEPGILPLLQETMVQLWDKRLNQTLTLAEYAALGDGNRSGLAVALARRGDTTLRRLTPPQADIARRILLRLISFGEGRSNTRRQQPCSKLRAADDNPTDFASVLKHLIEDRLLTIDEDSGGGDPRVDLAHEIMITAWPTLASWVQSHYLDEQRRRRFEFLAVRWIEHERSARSLLHSIELAEAEAWQRAKSARDLGQSSAVVELIVASRAAHNARRRLHFWTIVGAAIVVVVIALAIRARARHELELVIADQVHAATVAFDDARLLAGERDAVRSHAFGLFDSRRWNEGETVWDQVEALAAQEASQYRAASSHFESALSLDPARGSLRAQFADLTFERLLRAERDRRGDLADELRDRLAAYDDGRHSAALAAGARLELGIEPPGTQVWSERPGVDRQLLGRAPLPPLTLLPGSVILEFKAPGRLGIRLPVLLARGETFRQQIALPPAAAALPGMIYVPAGRFLFGSADDEKARRGFLKTPPIHEVETAAYFIGRYEVTFGEWIEFLNDLPPDERRLRRPDSAALKSSSLTLTEIGPRRWRLSLTPTTRTYNAENGQRLHYEHRTRRADQDWTRFPVAAVSYDDAVAYAAWLDRTGRIKGARLCDEYEWERAARGADGRTYPSGSALAADDANIDATYGRDPLAFGPDEVGSHPASRSPVGAEDMAGNVWEWMRSVETADAPVFRGGGWYYTDSDARSANRQPGEPTQRHVHLGVRVCATPAQ